MSNLYFLNLNMEKHPFHLVSPSFWPFLVSISCLSCFLNMILYMHFFFFSGLSLHVSFIFLFIFVYFWGSDILYESREEGYHTLKVQLGLSMGMVLFIISEVCFCMSYFCNY